MWPVAGARARGLELAEAVRTTEFTIDSQLIPRGRTNTPDTVHLYALVYCTALPYVEAGKIRRSAPLTPLRTGTAFRHPFRHPF